MTTKHIKKIGVVVAVVSILIAAFLWLTNRPPIGPGKTLAASNHDATTESFARLNQKARATKSADPDEIRSLTDEALNLFRISDVPPFIEEAIKERVARAEVDHRKEHKRGISEGTVAHTVNELAAKFEIPDYEKVSRAMVRASRMTLLVWLPHFVAQDTPGKKPRKKVGSAINPYMSPLEATSLTMFLIQQKIVNEDYQVSHQQFFANQRERQLQRWNDLRAAKAAGQAISEAAQPPSTHRASIDWNPRTKEKEIRQTIKNATAVMASNDLLNLVGNTLDNLGIAR
jgi:hypothetical protein